VERNGGVVEARTRAASKALRAGDAIQSLVVIGVRVGNALSRLKESAEPAHRKGFPGRGKEAGAVDAGYEREGWGQPRVWPAGDELVMGEPQRGQGSPATQGST
jgi:hypothetical protein